MPKQEAESDPQERGQGQRQPDSSFGEERIGKKEEDLPFAYYIPSRRVPRKPAAPSPSLFCCGPRSSLEPLLSAPSSPFAFLLPSTASRETLPIPLAARPKGAYRDLQSAAGTPNRKKKKRQRDRKDSQRHPSASGTMLSLWRATSGSGLERPIGSSLQPKKASETSRSFGFFGWAAALGQACPQEYQGRDVRSKTR